MTTLRWAIVSTGRISADFTRALQANGSAVVAVSSRSKASADAFGDKHGVAHRFASLEEMLAQAGSLFDVVYVGTPHSQHAADTIKALQAGAHVLCEKALAINAAQVRQMIAAANGRFLMEGMWTRFFPATKELQRMINAGDLGQVRAVHGTFGFYYGGGAPRLVELADAGGALLDIGVYLLFAASLAFGGFHKPDNTATVVAHAIKGSTGCDNQTNLQLELPGGRTATLFCSIQSALPNEILIIGTRGTVKISKPFHAPATATLTVALCDAEPGKVNAFEKTFLNEFSAAGFNFGGSEGFVHEIRAVEAAIAAGKTCCDEVSWDESLAVMKIMDEARSQIRLVYPSE